MIFLLLSLSLSLFLTLICSALYTNEAWKVSATVKYVFGRVAQSVVLHDEEVKVCALILSLSHSPSLSLFLSLFLSLSLSLLLWFC